MGPTWADDMVSDRLVICPCFVRCPFHHLKSAPDRHLCADKQAGRYKSHVISRDTRVERDWASGTLKAGLLLCNGLPASLAPLHGTIPRQGNPKAREKTGRKRGRTGVLVGHDCPAVASNRLWRRIRTNRRCRRIKPSCSSDNAPTPVIPQFPTGGQGARPSMKVPSSSTMTEPPMLPWPSISQRLARWAGYCT